MLMTKFGFKFVDGKQSGLDSRPALAQKPWVVPIPGTTKLHRLDENMGAAAVALTADDLREIDRAAIEIAGAIRRSNPQRRQWRLSGPFRDSKDPLHASWDA